MNYGNSIVHGSFVMTKLRGFLLVPGTLVENIGELLLDEENDLNILPER